MGWEHVGKGEGSESLPILKIDKNVRFRFVGPSLVPEIADNKKYADGPLQSWTHWAPDELAEKCGGARSIRCIDVRNGCLFHTEPLKWRSGKNNNVNVVVYEDVDVKKKTYGSRKIVVFQGGVQVFGTIREQAASIGVSPDQVDWVLSKTGKGLQTTYTAVPITDVLDKTFDIMEFDEQPNYADDDVPQLVDFTKFDSFKEMTPDDQRAWYENLMKANEKPPEEGDAPAAAGTEPPGPPAGAPGTQAATPPANGTKISLPGKRPPGRPSNAEKAATTAAAPPKAPAPPKPAGPSPEQIAYQNACTVADTTGVSMKDSEFLDFITEQDGPNEEYGVTQEMIDAAKLVKAGPPAPPAAAAPPKAPAPPKPAPAAAPEPEAGTDVTELTSKLLQLTKSSPVLKDFKKMRKFLDKCANGAKAVGKIEDPELLLELIALCEAGDEAIEEQLAD